MKKNYPRLGGAVILLCFLSLLIEPASSFAAVKNIYISQAGEPLPSMPINGKADWSSYVSKHSRIPFAVGFTYHLKVQYASISAGKIVTDCPEEIASINNVSFEFSSQSYEFDLVISPLANRLDSFNIGFTRGAGTTEKIACRTVMIGHLYSVVLCDTSGSTTSTLNDSVSRDLSIMNFKHASGAKRLTLFGSGLSHARLVSAIDSTHTAGLLFSKVITKQGDSAVTLDFTVSDLVQVKYGLFREHILEHLHDEAAAADDYWVSYKHAVALAIPGMVPASLTGRNPSEQSADFEFLPERRLTIEKGCEGFHGFLDASFRVE